MMMNFVIKLSLSMNSIIKKNYNAILIMIDCLTKYSHIVFFKKKYRKTIQIYRFNKLIKYHKLLKKTINDKNKLLIFNY